MSNQEVRSRIMGPQHQDIKYLMRDEIGGVIALGLADTVEAKPPNPVEFFAKWLLNYSKQQKVVEQVSYNQIAPHLYEIIDNFHL